MESISAVSGPEDSAQPETHPRGPPRRFIAEARAEWDRTPEVVRAEIHRIGDEMEGRFYERKAMAEVWRASGLDEYDRMFRKQGTSIREVLDRNTDIERTLKRDPLTGLAKIADAYEFDLYAIFHDVLGLPRPVRGPETH